MSLLSILIEIVKSILKDSAPDLALSVDYGYMFLTEGLSSGAGYFGAAINYFALAYGFGQEVCDVFGYIKMFNGYLFEFMSFAGLS